MHKNGARVADEGFYQNSYRLKGGAILVYTRPGAKKGGFQARLKVPGVPGYVTRALKTRQLNDATSPRRKTYSTSSSRTEARARREGLRQSQVQGFLEAILRRA
jgi:hypothetical protein